MLCVSGHRPAATLPIASEPRRAYHSTVISEAATPARLEAGLPASGLGRVLAAFALGLLALGFLTLVTAQGGSPASITEVRPIVAVMSADTAGKAPVILKLDRDITAIAADIELLADPAMPGPTVVTVPARRFGAAGFREANPSPPPSAPAGSPLRPPRAA